MSFPLSLVVLQMSFLKAYVFNSTAHFKKVVVRFLDIEISENAHSAWVDRLTITHKVCKKAVKRFLGIKSSELALSPWLGRLILSQLSK